jgi:organic hydroperoxide reductase OsmC/OhrA
MADHVATVEWQSDGEYRTGRYSRAHVWTFDGGAKVPASSSPHVVPVPMSAPEAVDPEEALIAAASSCHMLSFLWVAHAAGLDISHYRDVAHGRMGKTESGGIGITRILLKPEITFAGRTPDKEELARLHEEAHEQCFIANSLRSEILVES